MLPAEKGATITEVEEEDLIPILGIIAMQINIVGLIVYAIMIDLNAKIQKKDTRDRQLFTIKWDAVTITTVNQ